MIKNMGNVDRAIRLLIVVGIGVLYLTGRLSGTWALILGVVGGVFFATSLIGVCPAYKLLKISTLGKKSSGAPAKG